MLKIIRPWLFLLGLLTIPTVPFFLIHVYNLTAEGERYKSEFNFLTRSEYIKIHWVFPEDLNKSERVKAAEKISQSIGTNLQQQNNGKLMKREKTANGYDYILIGEDADDLHKSISPALEAVEYGKGSFLEIIYDREKEHSKKIDL